MLLPRSLSDIIRNSKLADDKLFKMALKNISSRMNEITFSKVFDTSLKRTVHDIINWQKLDEEIHTGQKWSPNDYRMCRFTDKTKLVNPNWAVRLIADVPPIPVKGRVTWCDGGSGSKGHPKVYINLDKPGSHSCLYCGLRYCKEDNHDHN